MSVCVSEGVYVCVCVSGAEVSLYAIQSSSLSRLYAGAN